MLMAVAEIDDHPYDQPGDKANPGGQGKKSIWPKQMIVTAIEINSTHLVSELPSQA
jgi:hypothetical protein